MPMDLTLAWMESPLLWMHDGKSLVISKNTMKAIVE
jgi:hypothetical protein